MAEIADVFHTLRRLVREPRFTLAASGTLGVAVAACALVLAFGWATMVQPASLFREPERIVDVQASRTGGGEGSRHAVYAADFLVWREAAKSSFEAFGAYVPIGEADLTDRPGGGEPVHLSVHRVTADLFPALGVPPARGRTFEPAEETPGSDRVAVLSDHLARRIGIGVGADVTLDGEPHRVVGVMPPGFGVRGGFPDLWLPLSFGPRRPADRRSATLGIIGRLRPGASIDRAAAELSAVAAGLEERFPDSNEDLRPSLLPLVELMWTGLRPTVRLLLGAVLAVLGVAAVNLSNLLLARSIARRGELAVRASLGAGPGRLARQSVLETVAVSGLGALLGVAVAAAALPMLPDLHGRFLYRSIDLRLGWPVLALTAGLALAAGALAGIAPALRAARIGRPSSGGDGVGSRVSRGRRAVLATDLLVVGQVAVTLALLSGAGLLVRGLVERVSADPGYSTERVTAFEVAPPPARYPDAGSLARFDDRLRAALEGLPGVVVSASSDGVTGAGWGVSVWPDGATGRGRAEDGEPLRLSFRLVTPGWLEAMEIPLLAGRAVDEADRAGGRTVALLSRKAVERLYGAEAGSPIGRTLAVDEPAASHTVIGVVGDVAPAPGETPEPTIYLAYAQHADLLDVVEQRARLFVVRTAAPGSPGADAIARTVAALDPDLPVSGLGPLSDRIADLTFRPRLSIRIVTAFALLALALAAVGLYSLLADAVARRRREIGIRIALGAGRREVMALFARPTAGKIGAGVLLGAALTVAFTRWLASRIEGVLPEGGIDPSAALTGAAIALALLLVAVTLATAPPIRRALRTEPREVLSE